MKEKPITGSIVFTSQQYYDLYPMFRQMAQGDTIIAQVYTDGMRCRLLNADETEAVRKALGTESESSHRFMFEAVKEKT